jgi:hypothetical protein
VSGHRARHRERDPGQGPARDAEGGQRVDGGRQLGNGHDRERPRERPHGPARVDVAAHAAS